MAPRVPDDRRPRWLIAALTCALILAAGGSSRADDENPTVSLGLTRDPGAEACVTARELAQRVEARLGHATFVSAAQADLFVDVRVTRAGRGWRATVAASRANGARVGVRKLETRSDDCRSLDEDLVLVVALVIDPMATGTAPVAAPVHRDVIYVAVPVHVPGASPTWSFGARIATTILGGMLPSLAPGLDLAVAATPPGAWPIELGAIATPRASADEAGHGADVRLMLGTVAVCPEILERHRVRLQLCGGGAAGVLLVRPRGLGPEGGGHRAAGLLLGRARGSLRIAGGVHAAVDIGMTVPLTRRSLYYTELDPTTLQVERHDLHGTPAIGWVASLGLGVRLR